MATIPPVPNEELKESHIWREWFQNVRRTVASTGALSFSLYFDSFNRLYQSRLPYWLINKYSVSSAEVFTIPDGYQTIMYGQFFVDGILTVDGQLVII